MKKKTLLLVAAFLLSLPTWAVGQENKRADEAPIRQIIQYYFDGWKNYDAESIKKAFHPQARLFYQSKEVQSDIAKTTGRRLSTYFERYGHRKTQETLIQKILSIDVTGEAATVKVEFIYPDSWLNPGSVSLLNPPPGVVEARYLSLIKFNDGWKIVSEVFSVREGR